MQIKTTVTYDLTSVRIAIKKKKEAMGGEGGGGGGRERENKC